MPPIKSKLRKVMLGFSHVKCLVSHLFYCGIIIILAAGCRQSVTSEIASPYAFFVAGHVSGNPSNFHQGLHPPFKERLFLINEDSSLSFGVLNGDMVKKGSTQNFTALRDDLAQISAPIYFVAGNHDVTDRPLYEANFGESYYAFKQQHELFIILDSNLDGWNISGDQLEFLREALSSAGEEVSTVFIFVHHLLWWSRENIFKDVRINSSTGRHDRINFYEEILPLVQALERPVYFIAGDVGAQATGSEIVYHREGQITYLASGMGGGVRDHFLKFTIETDQQIKMEIIALNGDDPYALGDIEDYRLPQ